jgi:hypothetical protein
MFGHMIILESGDLLQSVILRFPPTLLIPLNYHNITSTRELVLPLTPCMYSQPPAHAAEHAKHHDDGNNVAS